MPERIRRRALRKLWGLNPVLANLDGLVDYAEDYTDAATVVDNLQTVYKIGKGMLAQFADAEEDGSGAPESSSENLPEKDKPSEENKTSEVDAAPHNEDVESEEAAVQLTQAEDAVLASDMDSNQVNTQEIEEIKVEFDFQVTRKRLRFDYG